MDKLTIISGRNPDKAVQKKVFIAIPSMRAEVKIYTALSLVNSVSELINNGWCADLSSWVGDSILPSARNVMFGKFYDSDASDMMFIDDDIAWQPGDLLRLLSYPVELVGGTYRVKQDDPRYTFRTLPGSTHTTHPETGLLEVEGLPTGFLRISRAAADRMAKAYPDRKYQPHFDKAPKTWCFFDWPYIEGQGLWGEDFGFCKRFREAGGQIWLDTHLELSHWGHKEYGPVSLHKHLEKKGAITGGPPAVSITPATFEKLKGKLDTDEMRNLFKVALGRAA